MQWNSSFKLGTRFECLRCASCCEHVRYGVSLTDKDHLRIVDTTPIGVSFAEKISHPVFSFNLARTKEKCFFLDGKDCSIRGTRPLLCRLYPFQIGIDHEGEILLCLNHCPGVGRPDGELIDKRYIQEILRTILELEGEGFIMRLKAYFSSIRKHPTPLLRTINKIIYSDRKAKHLLEEMILEMIQSGSFSDLTPWERLWCVYYDALPLLSCQISDQVETLVTEQDIVKCHEATKNRLSTALLESVDFRAKQRGTLEREGRVAYETQNKLFFACSPEDEVPIRSSMGEKFTMRIGDILKTIPFSNDAISKEIDYLEEIIKREGMYGAVVCDASVDIEVFLLMRIADALELQANAFTIKRGKNCVGIPEIIEAIRSVDGSLTEIATTTFGSLDGLSLGL